MTSRLLINPRAGLLKGCIDPAVVREKLKRLILNPEITVAQDEAGIQAFIELVKQDPPEVVIVAGGDGTAAAIMKALRDVPVTFGLIPTGSTNNIGLSIGLGDDLDEAIDVINQAHVAQLDIGEVNGRLFIESVGIGLLANIMSDVGEQDSKKEVLKVLATTLTKIATAEALQVAMQADDREITAETVWLTVTNTGRAAAALVDPTANVHDHQLELVYCEPLETSEIARYVLAFVRNSHIRERKFHRLRMKHLDVRLRSQTTVHVDGELHTWDRLMIRVIPGALRVYTP